ncbi:MAG: DUF4194 domain-containing protein [Bacteroidota bacterium]
MSDLENNIRPYSKAVVQLLKSPVARKSTIWEDIIAYQDEIQQYINVMGLELILKREDGYAFVKQFEDSEGKTLGLVTRTLITFKTSVVLVVLRQALEDFDSDPTQSTGTEKFITDTEIREELELFVQEDSYNRLKFEKQLDTHIKRAVDLGYLKVVDESELGTRYCIQRIIKEKISLDMLEDFKTKLQAHV